MKTMKKALLVILFFAGILGTALAQPGDEKLIVDKEDVKKFEKAEFLFNEGNYLAALPIYLELEQKYPDELLTTYRAGVCYMYKTDERKRAVQYLRGVERDVQELFNSAEDPDDVAEQRFLFRDVKWNLGQALHLTYEFDQAKAKFEEHLNGLEYEEGEDEMDEHVRTVERYISHCDNAKEIIGKEVNVRVTNMGAPISTASSEAVPVISADESVMIFTYTGLKSEGGKRDPVGKPSEDGKYYEDVFITNMDEKDSVWTEPQSIGTNINSVEHDASIALSVDGQTLFIYKNDKRNKGDIYVSYLEGTEWTEPVPLKGDVNTNKSWEGSVTLSSDGKKIYFASDREGGLGGLDLYEASLNDEGEWTDIKNLGPSINTPFKEDAPFIHPDNKTLYFSSEGHTSIGGFDVFYAYKKEDGWDTPQNIGYPINTPGNDIYYVISADGERGYFSSNRADGFGEQDIYTVTPGAVGAKPILALVLGQVALDDQPVEANITLTDVVTNKESHFKSNASTGKYMIAVTPGNKYKIAIEVEGHDPQIDYINVQSLNSYVKVKHDFKLYSDEYKAQHNITDDKLVKLQEKIDTQVEKYNTESTKPDTSYLATSTDRIHDETGPFNESADSVRVLQGDSIVDLSNELDVNTEKDTTLRNVNTEAIAGVHFKVEIGAVANPDEFNLHHLSQYGKIQQKTYSDGVTRYSMGPFATLEEAEAFRLMLIEKEPKAEDAFVTVFVLGQRKTTDEYEANPVAGVREVEALPNNEFMISVTIQKNEVTGFGRLSEVIPEGFDAESVENKTAQFNSEETSAKYLWMNVPGDEKFTVQYKLKAREGVTGNFEVSGAFGYLMNDEKMSADIAPVTFEIAPVVAGPCVPTYRSFQHLIGKDLNIRSNYEQLLQTGGNYCKDGLTYTVQVAAYRHPENYKYDHLTQFGNVDKRDYPDGITRFTMREYNTLTEAEDFRQQCIGAGQKDAWVTAWYNGKRVLLEELIKVDFYGMPVNTP